ncbi:serine hydrolase [Rugamonas sp. FT82W]|uniref:Serine hydrolase n=1 Tax=Duganella vulcania TaxID=2692166 RepID=A0A845GF96_9BURK|nr:serine hydrolase domain-containing protein [Duganella vulcania]MYM91449.1 serine hydrolase [Duganella vulcania]
MSTRIRNRIRHPLLAALPLIALGVAAPPAPAQDTTQPLALPVPTGYPPAVCAPPPASAPKEHPRHASNALPYRPFPATWQRTIDSLVANGGMPGAVVIVRSPDWGVRVGVTGVANLATKQPMSPDMQFRVGSVSKAFLAQAILRLEQQGKIQLTAPVLTYLADNPTVRGIPGIDKLTVTNLLQMSSGIANYLNWHEVGFSPQITPQRAFKPDELLAAVSATGVPTGSQPSGAPPVAPTFPPGATYPNPYWVTLFASAPPAPPQYPGWDYSNTNYILLGLIAEKVTGLPVEEVIQREVFDVAGLKDTYFATDTKRLPAMHGYTKWGAIPYTVQVYNDWCDVTNINPTYAWTAGAIVSTPWDLLKFEDAMFRTDTLLNQGTKNKWYTFVSADIHIGWQPMQYGVGGLMQPERSYGTARGHGGAFPGYKTLLYYFHDQQTSFVLATNTWDESCKLPMDPAISTAENGQCEVVMLDAVMPQVSSAVTTPWPPRGATTHVDHGRAAVKWQAGRIYGQRYDVYWGTDQAAVDSASEDHHPGTQRSTVTGLTALLAVKLGTTYYWRVDTVAPDNKTMPLTIGPTWNFQTK